MSARRGGTRHATVPSSPTSRNRMGGSKSLLTKWRKCEYLKVSVRQPFLLKLATGSSERTSFRNICPRKNSVVGFLLPGSDAGPNLGALHAELSHFLLAQKARVRVRAQVRFGRSVRKIRFRLESRNDFPMGIFSRFQLNRDRRCSIETDAGKGRAPFRTVNAKGHAEGVPRIGSLSGYDAEIAALSEEKYERRAPTLSERGQNVRFGSVEEEPKPILTRR